MEMKCAVDKEAIGLNFLNCLIMPCHPQDGPTSVYNMYLFNK